MGRQSDALQERIHRFALRVLALIPNLPASEPGATIGRQLARSATSMDMNYRATCRSRTHREFASSIAVVAEEADETLGWLTTTGEAGLLTMVGLGDLLAEAGELRAILAASASTARRRERAARSKPPNH